MLKRILQILRPQTPAISDTDFERLVRHAKAVADMGDRKHAERLYREAIRLSPTEFHARNNLATLLIEDGALDEAEFQLLEILANHPASVAARVNLAEVKLGKGSDVDAIALLEQAVALNPTSKIAHERLGMLLLGRGDLSRAAWEHYAWHKTMEVEENTGLSSPVWKGEDLSHRSIALIAHQGLGDQILFASCIPDVVSMAGQVHLFAEPRLITLFRRSFPSVAVDSLGLLASKTLEKRFDYQAALARLLIYLRDGTARFPGQLFLRPCAKRVGVWKNRLDGLGPGPKIGISWRGGLGTARARDRSIDLAQWQPVLNFKDAHFISLQYSDCRADLQEAENTMMKIHHFQDAIDDYDETAALVQALDLVITVTTSVVHLGGALGQPVWVLVDAAAQWRYVGHGERMPWYSSVRLFHQSHSGEWADVMKRVRSEVEEHFRHVG